MKVRIFVTCHFFISVQNFVLVRENDDKIKTLVDVDRHITIQEIREKLKLSNSAVHDHLKRLGFVSKFKTWVPHKLKKIDLESTHYHLRFTLKTLRK